RGDVRVMGAQVASISPAFVGWIFTTQTAREDVHVMGASVFVVLSNSIGRMVQTETLLGLGSAIPTSSSFELTSLFAKERLWWRGGELSISLVRVGDSVYGSLVQRGQLSLEFPSTWGGRRRGAGRKRVNARPCVPHRRRAEHSAAHPVHVTLRSLVRSLRTQMVF